MTHDTHPPGRTRKGAQAARRGGFTLIELITVIIVLGILAAVAASSWGSLSGPELGRMSEIRAQLRYVQLRALKSGGVFGMRCEGTNYWAFVGSGTNSTALDSRLQLPGETSTLVDMSAATGKNMSMTAFTYYFDGFGIPYTAYDPSGTTTKLAAPATISITAGGQTGSLTLTPETGYVP
jgi:MSHA pilin protein MshC